MTLNQLSKRRKKGKRFHRKIVIKKPALKKTIRTIYRKGLNDRYKLVWTVNPHKAGKCKKLFILTPKKPNSAQRKVAKVELSNGRIVPCFIPGMSITHGMDVNSKVIIKGGKVPDLPGIHYRIIRGKLDCRPDITKANARSRYGVAKGKTKYDNVVDEWNLR